MPTVSFKTPTETIPKTDGPLIDKYYEVKQLRLKMEKAAGEVKKLETQLQNEIIERLPKSKVEGAQGKIARATIKKDAVPTVEDWDKVFAYVKRNGAFDLLQRRISVKAVEERADAGKKIPGIGVFNKVTVSLNKV